MAQKNNEFLVLTLQNTNNDIIIMQPCAYRESEESGSLTKDIQEIEIALLQLRKVTQDISEFLSYQGEQLDTAVISTQRAEESIKTGTTALSEIIPLNTSSKLVPALIGIGIGTIIAGPIGFLLSANAGVGLLCVAAGGSIGGIGTSYLLPKMPSLPSLPSFS